MPHEVNAFQCCFCRRVFRRKQDAENHERACKYNPERRSCYTCALFREGDYTETLPSLFTDEKDDEIVLHGMICTKHGEPIWKKPYYIECDFYDGYGDEQPMPGTCLYYEKK